LQRKDRATNVHREVAVEMLKRLVDQARRFRDAGIEDQGIDPAMRLLNHGHDLPEVLRHACVRDDPTRASADAPGSLLDFLGPAPRKEDRSSFGRESLCDRETDAPCATHNQRNLVPHSSHRAILILSDGVQIYRLYLLSRTHYD
jgi:hypothetical protein